MGKSIYIISNHQLDWNIDIKDELKRRFDKNWSSFLEEEISIEDNNNKSKEIFVATNLNRIEFEFTKFGYISLASNRDLGEVKIYKNVVVYESPYVGKYDFIFPLVLSKKWQSEINIAEEDYVQAKAEIEDVLKDIEYVSKLIGGGRLMFLNEKSYDELLDEIINGARFKTLEVKLSRMKKPSFSLKDYLDWIENQKDDTPPWFLYEQIWETSNQSPKQISAIDIISFAKKKEPRFFYTRKPTEFVKTDYKYGQRLILQGQKKLYQNIIDFWLATQAWYSDGEDDFYQTLVFDDLTSYSGWHQDENRVGLCEIIQGEEKLDYDEKINELVSLKSPDFYMIMDDRWNNQKVLFEDGDFYYLYYFWTGE